MCPSDLHSRLKNNNVTAPATGGTALFVNSGRGFSEVEYPVESIGVTLPNNRIGTQNRIRSEDFSPPGTGYYWAKPGAVTLTAAQADPFGGTLAALWTTTGGGNFGPQINISNLMTDQLTAASGANGRLVVSIWLKYNAGFSTVSMTQYDSVLHTVTKFDFNLTSTWNRFQVVLTGVSTVNTLTLYFYPGGVGSVTAGSFFMSHPCVSDFGSGYITGTGTTVATGSLPAP